MFSPWFWWSRKTHGTLTQAQSLGDAPPTIKPKHLNPNRIRDHLANERTYLSWMRSGIALMGFGVLIVRMRMLRAPMAPQLPGNGWKLSA
jgi:hypothetical protein